MVGFAWAAFEAGARNAVTSLWEVDDRSTTELMNHFYTEVTHGKSYAAALREAKLHMLEGNFKKPYYWAPFQLYSRNLSDRP
jgi:CHAT domain-containing protein